MIRLKPMLVVWSASALVVVLYYGVLRQHVFHVEDTHAEVYVAVAFLVVTVVGLVAAFIIRVVTAIMGRPAPDRPAGVLRRGTHAALADHDDAYRWALSQEDEQ